MAVMGSLDGQVPSIALPDVGWGDFEPLLPGALAIAVIGYAESAAVAQSLADEHRYEVKPNRELMAVGSANVLSGFFQGFITGGGASQSAANDRAGAQSQLVSLLVSVLTALTAIALLPLFRDLPQAVLGAIVISAVLSFLNVKALVRVAQLRRDGFFAALVALVGVLILGVLPGLLIAVALSVLVLLSRVAKPAGSLLGRVRGTAAYADLKADAEAGALPGVLIYRLDAPLMFVNAKLLRQDVRDRLKAEPEPVRIVILDLSFSADLDIESIDVLESLREELKETGVELWLGNVHRGVREKLTLPVLAGSLGTVPVYQSLDAAALAAEVAIGPHERLAS